MTDDVDLVVVGGGPAGLAAAVAAARGRRRTRDWSSSARRRPVASRATPRTRGTACASSHRLLDGPAYARRWRERAERAGVDLRTATTVTGWDDRGAAP